MTQISLADLGRKIEPRLFDMWASLGVRELKMGHDLISRGHSGPGTDYWCCQYLHVKIN